jgi:hypothetical protein
MTVIIGDTTVYSDPGYGSGCPDGKQTAFKFQALATDTIGTLFFRIGESLDSTMLNLEIYSDNAGLPDALLGSAPVTSGLAVNSWAAAPGLSVPIVAGDWYHLAILPPDEGGGAGLQYYFFSPDHSVTAPQYYQDATGLSAPADPFGSGSATSDFPSVGFYGDTEGAGAGGGGGGDPARSGFEVAITTHHDLETETPAHVVQWVRSRTAVQLDLAKSDQRSGKVTISVCDGAAALFDSGANDYLYRLFIRLNGVPALWAPIETSWDAETKTVTMSAVDVDRMQAHYVRDGDEAIDPTSSFDGKLPVDYRGMRLLRDAANNTPEQDARFVAPLGIRDGEASTEHDARVKVGRGDEVFGDMKQLAQGVAAPDISVDVLDVEDPDAYPDYMVLNSYDRQGTDRTTGADAVVLQCGYGLENLTGFKLTPSAFVTHAHVLGDGGHPRVTRFHALSSRQRGVYVRWVATQLKVDPSDTTALEEIAAAIIKAYGVPLHAYDIKMKPDSLQGRRLLRDFGIGDTITAGVKEGYLNREIAARIMAASVKETGKVRDTITSLTVVPSLVDDEDIGGDEQ